MKVICRPRQSGKTYEVIKRCMEEGGYIVCPNMDRAHKVSLMADDLGIDIPYPITFYDFMSGKYYPDGIKKFHIDDIDLCLQRFSRVPISTISLTSGEEE